MSGSRYLPGPAGPARRAAIAVHPTCDDAAVMDVEVDLAGDLAERLLPWYDSAARDLPWRAPGVSAWAVLVSEVMLQQTPVRRVLPAYEAWLARWPTPAALAAEPAGEAVRMWGKLGY